MILFSYNFLFKNIRFIMEFLAIFLSVAIFLSFVRFLKGPTLSDRVVAFDTMSIIVVSLLTIFSVTLKTPLYLDVAFVFALIGFIVVILFARFIVIGDRNA